MSYQYLEVLREQCQGAFLCLIEMDRMSRRLAAKAAPQEEAGKHAYATYIAIEDCQALLNTEIRNIVVSMHFPADDHAFVYWPDEDSVSVITLSSIASPPAVVVGEGCQVRIGRKTFKAVTMKIGMRALLLLLLLLLLQYFYSYSHSDYSLLLLATTFNTSSTPAFTTITMPLTPITTTTTTTATTTTAMYYYYHHYYYYYYHYCQEPRRL